MNDGLIHNKLGITLSLPEGQSKLLLHSCCAPCSCEIMRTLKETEINLAILFYNPNIDTFEEYSKRKIEVVRYAEKLNIPFFDLDYDKSLWVDRVHGLEKEREKGKRCSVCFDIRMERSALFAYENGFDIFTSSIGISRHKDFEQITQSGIRAALKYHNLVYWDLNWRKSGGAQRMESLARAEGFYRQNYCGCIYSKRG
ncbi:MAG: epoxyqueuosine reductase QueH [Lentisphaerota bacterium]